MYEDCVTDPRNHDSEDFIYIVHGFMPRGKEPPEFMARKVDRIFDEDKFFCASMIGNLSEENAKKRFGYGRKIAQTGNFGGYGLILRPEDENVYVAWNSDIGSPTDEERLNKFALKNKYKRKTPFELLTETPDLKGLKYNEMIIRGSKGNKVEGVFYQDGWKGVEEGNHEELKSILSKIYETELPLVELPEFKNSYDVPEGVDEDTWRRVNVLSTQSQIMQSQIEFDNYWEDRQLERIERTMPHSHHF